MTHIRYASNKNEKIQRINDENLRTKSKKRLRVR